MKRKTIMIGGIVVGVLVLLVILLGPAAPLFVKLGVKPICFQGDLAHLHAVACPESVAARPTVTPYSLPTLAGQASIPMIFDDDGSPDGMIALLYFLRNPLYDVKAITISAGEAHPQLFAGHLARLLAAVGKADIPIGAGKATPLAGENAFPEPWRQASDNFWGVTLPLAPAPAQPAPAAELIVETLNHSTSPMMVFVSGTHTNLAEALRLDPGIPDHIRDVYVMGGSINVPGNIENEWPAIHNRTAEWNIWVDPLAASEVFASGLPLHLVPLDATNRLEWTGTEAHGWAKSAIPETTLAGKLLENLLKSWSAEKMYVWDLVAAAAATDARLCPQERLAVEIVLDPGPDQGRTVVKNGDTPNVWVCLKPDAEQIKANVASILRR
jgi:inosine-uridine nucleoside N-ribohydrolase